ncbi:WG repeat-containing protein [Chryseobacterium sp. StRB126]|uniref:WG repeat-containing protein n=1 Tax=Chryseobacterium sp. StRB126 TaxID=878220 RepID=UPI0018E09665|nr:WG repeat-containing protein [Chryseobacterium sp. StRB126]
MMKKTIISILLSASCLWVNAQKYNELYPLKKANGYIGYYLSDGTNVIPPQFCSATYNTDGYYLVSKAEHEYNEAGRRKEEHIPGTEKYGILNSKGEWIIGLDNTYSSIGISNGFIKVTKNDLSGIVNDKNEILIPLEYEELDPMDSTLISAKKNGKEGIIDIQNKTLVPFLYDTIYGFHFMNDKNQFYSIVRIGDQYGVVDKNGKYVIKLSDVELVSLTDTTVIIRKSGLFGLSDFQMKTIIPFEYNDAYLYGQELFFQKDNVNYYFSPTGKLLRKEKAESGKENALKD